MRWSGENKEPDTTNVTLLKDSYRGGEIIVWALISLDGHTNLLACHGGILTAVRYRDEILSKYVTPYDGAVEDEFILTDNDRSHRTTLIEECLEYQGLEPIEEWPAKSSNFNTIQCCLKCYSEVIKKTRTSTTNLRMYF